MHGTPCNTAIDRAVHQVCGYHGPVLMTYPTFAMAPIMLEDYVKVCAVCDLGGRLTWTAVVRQCGDVF